MDMQFANVKSLTQAAIRLADIRPYRECYQFQPAQRILGAGSSNRP